MFKGFFNRMMYGRSDRPDLLVEDMAQNKFQLFFEILGIKIWELIKLNLLLIVFLIPLLAWSYINYQALSVMIETSEAAAFGFSGVEFDNLKMTYLLGLIPCLVIAGPALAGINFIIRNYTQERHAWLWSDFVEQMKANAKQAILYMLILGVVLYFGDRMVSIYSAMESNVITVIMKTALMIFLSFFFMSSLYIFPMMVTYDMKLRHLIRNSLMFTLARLHFSVLFWVLVLLPGALLLLLSVFWSYGIIGLLIYYLIFGFTFGIYIINSYTNATFAKYMNKGNDDDKDDGKMIKENEEQEEEQVQTQAQKTTV